MRWLVVRDRCSRAIEYRELWPGLGDIVQPGMPFVALVHHAQELGLRKHDPAVDER